jgi:hypothetical protein
MIAGAIRSLNCGQQGPDEEETMHPDIIQTIAAERRRSLQEHAAACRRTEPIGRSRRVPHPRPLRRMVWAAVGLRPREA